MINLFFTKIVLLFLGNIVDRAREDSLESAQKEVSISSQNTKDDIAHLMHLFKEPSTQIHWSNLYGILSCAELDARKSTGAQSEAANALSCLAEIYNDYGSFHPQNLMVQYISPGVNRHPIKKILFAPSAPEWAELANETHNIKPTNLLHKGILRDEAWI